mmetsp:Transcript_8512/g.53195  ORF Transcript_8512/g.53195 Transcript_8512/m.53195 type:complete len:123 (-) Transcript_8512:179-547(-)
MRHKDLSDAGQSHVLMANSAAAQHCVSMMRPRVRWEYTDVQDLSRIAGGVESRLKGSLVGDACSGCTSWSDSFESARTQDHRNNVDVPYGPIASVGSSCCSWANVPSVFFVEQATTSMEEWH